MRYVLGCILIFSLTGCMDAHRTDGPQISIGARQDENYEISGKPQGGTAPAETTGVGYNNKGGEMNAQAAEQAAANGVHYHYHTHLHGNSSDGSSYETAGMPQGGTGAPAGYSNANYSVQRHRSSMNPYATPYSVVKGPYANSPNDGNAAKRSYPYYTNVYGSAGLPGGGGWGVGSVGWGSGGANFSGNGWN